MKPMGIIKMQIGKVYKYEDKYCLALEEDKLICFINGDEYSVHVRDLKEVNISVKDLIDSWGITSEKLSEIFQEYINRVEPRNKYPGRKKKSNKFIKQNHRFLGEF